MPNEETPTDNTQNGGIEALATETIEQEPRINEKVVANLEEKEKEQAAPEPITYERSTQSDTYDDTIFDPNRHEIDPKTGQPARTKAGKYRRKRGGGGKRATNSTETPNATTQSAPVDYAGLADMTLNMVFGGLCMFLGPHWAPSPQEYAEIRKHTIKTLEYYELPEIPPPLALAVVVGMYSLPRYYHPDTQSRLNKRKQVPNQAPSEDNKDA